MYIYNLHFLNTLCMDWMMWFLDAKQQQLLLQIRSLHLFCVVHNWVLAECIQKHNNFPVEVVLIERVLIIFFNVTILHKIRLDKYKLWVPLFNCKETERSTSSTSSLHSLNFALKVWWFIMWYFSGKKGQHWLGKKGVNCLCKNMHCYSSHPFKI